MLLCELLTTSVAVAYALEAFQLRQPQERQQQVCSPCWKWPQPPDLAGRRAFFQACAPGHLARCTGQLLWCRWVSSRGR